MNHKDPCVTAAVKGLKKSSPGIIRTAIEVESIINNTPYKDNLFLARSEPVR